MINIDQYTLPESVKEEFAHCALSPQQKANFQKLLPEREFTMAYAIFGMKRRKASSDLPRIADEGEHTHLGGWSNGGWYTLENGVDTLLTPGLKIHNLAIAKSRNGFVHNLDAYAIQSWSILILTARKHAKTQARARQDTDVYINKNESGTISYAILQACTRMNTPLF